MMKLTIRQQEVLNLLIEYQRVHGFPPTTYELTGMLGCRSPNAAASHLKALEKKGRDQNYPRGFPRYKHR
ncbi:SOS-response repressor and protease LexA [Klebsiella pneumoniae]|nr:SOS-response repressor and protease LexA [Klebsiella pneumoniae]VGF24828.1 SOS-response repressor and protease LexA [Klebsiella pneumoniae]